LVYHFYKKYCIWYTLEIVVRAYLKSEKALEPAGSILLQSLEL
jgi:hypothetical protein